MMHIAYYKLYGSDALFQVHELPAGPLKNGLFAGDEHFSKNLGHTPKLRSNTSHAKLIFLNLGWLLVDAPRSEIIVNRGRKNILGQDRQKLSQKLSEVTLLTRKGR